MSLQALIEEKLRAELEPCHLEVINESGMHNAPAGAESHFKVIVVSEKFEGVSIECRVPVSRACCIVPLCSCYCLWLAFVPSLFSNALQTRWDSEATSATVRLATIGNRKQ